MIQTARVAELNLAYLDQGSSEPVLLLVHGFPLDHSMWSAQISELATLRRVIAPDLRGFGRTPLAASPEQADAFARGGVTMEQYADDLAGLLATLRIQRPIVLAGFSMGGYVAWQFVRKYPGRVAALVLADTRAAADNPEAQAARLQMADEVAQRGAAAVAEQMEPKLFAQQTRSARPQVVAATRKVIAATAPEAIAAAQRGMAQRPDVTDMLPAITVPTLLIVGEDDAISRVEEMRAMSEAIPSGRLVVVSGAGHMAPVENPAAVTAAIRELLEEQTRT